MAEVVDACTGIHLGPNSISLALCYSLTISEDYLSLFLHLILLLYRRAFCFWTILWVSTMKFHYQHAESEGVCKPDFGLRSFRFLIADVTFLRTVKSGCFCACELSAISARRYRYDCRHPHSAWVVSLVILLTTPRSSPFLMTRLVSRWSQTSDHLLFSLSLLCSPFFSQQILQGSPSPRLRPKWDTAGVSRRVSHIVTMCVFVCANVQTCLFIVVHDSA